VSLDKVESSNPILTAAHAGASTGKPQHLQPKASDIADAEGRLFQVCRTGWHALSRLASHIRVLSKSGGKPALLRKTTILLIEFLRTYVEILRRPRARRTRRLPESAARSGWARELSRLTRVTRPLCDSTAAIVQSIRVTYRTTSHDLDGGSKKLEPKHAPSRAKSVKRSKKFKQIEKTKEKPFWTLAVTSQCRILADTGLRTRTKQWEVRLGKFKFRRSTSADTRHGGT
jgi:hypothetical protein